jgi:hypothetical protein
MSEFFDTDSEQDLIQQLLDKIYPSLNDPNSSFYLPNLVKSQGYDPYIVPGGWPWTITDSTTLNLANTICLDIAVGDNNWPCSAASIPYKLDPSVALQLTLNGTPPDPGLKISGLSNVVSERPTVASDGVTVTQVVQLSTISNLAPAMTLTGSFVITLNCCCMQNNDCIQGTSQPQPGYGTFVATVPNPKDKIATPGTATVVFKITEIAPNVLTLEVESVTYALPVNTSGNPSIFVDIKITSAGDEVGFNNLAQEAFNSASGIATILSNLNNVLNEADALTKFQDIVTTEVDSYLKQNNLYPFNNPSLALH